MGYHRAEILGAMASIFLIWGLLVWLNYEATMRIITPPTDPIDAKIMLICACIGFTCNVINFCALNASCGKKSAEEDEDAEGTETSPNRSTNASEKSQQKTHLLPRTISMSATQNA